MKLRVKSIRKLRPYDPIEIMVPTGVNECFRYRRYEQGTWFRSDDGGKTYGAAASAVEIALLIQLLILWQKEVGSK